MNVPGFGQTSLMPALSYGVKFNGGTPTDTHLILWRGEGRWLQLELKAPPGANVTRWGEPLKSFGSLGALASQDDSAYFYDTDNKVVHIKLVGNGDWEEIRVRS